MSCSTPAAPSPMPMPYPLVVSLRSFNEPTHHPAKVTVPT
jgi:hypothetical protein